MHLYKEHTQRTKGRVSITAHRGMGVLEKPRNQILEGAKFFPENSIAAFQEAIQGNVHAVECDVHLSKDGHVMVIHGTHIYNYADYIGTKEDQKDVLRKQEASNVEQLTKDQIQSEYVLKGMSEEFDHKPKEEKQKIIKDAALRDAIVRKKRENLQTMPDYTRVPTLKSLLELIAQKNKERKKEGLHQVKLNIELKGKGTGITSIKTIEDFYNENPENKENLNPENIIFLGRRDVLEVSIVNAVLHGLRDHTRLDDVLVKLEEELSSNAKRNFLKKVAKGTIVVDTGYERALLAHDNIAKILDKMLPNYSTALVGSESKLIVAAYIKTVLESGEELDYQKSYDDIHKMFSTKEDVLLILKPGFKEQLQKLSDMTSGEFKKHTSLLLKKLDVKKSKKIPPELEAKVKYVTLVHNDIGQEIGNIQKENKGKNEEEKKPLERISARDKPDKDKYLEHAATASFKKEQKTHNLRTQLQRYFEDDTKTTTTPLHKLQRYTPPPLSESSTESLVRMKTTLMVTTGELFSEEAVNKRSEDFDLKSGSAITMEGAKLVQGAIALYRYNGIDCSLFDVNEKLLEVINQSQQEVSLKFKMQAQDFVMGLSASNWKASAQEASPVTLDYALAKAQVIAKKIECEVLVKVDEPIASMLVYDFILNPHHTADVISKFVHDIRATGIQEPDINFLLKVANIGKYELENIANIPINYTVKPPRSRRKSFEDVLSPEAIRNHDSNIKQFNLMLDQLMEEATLGINDRIQATPTPPTPLLPSGFSPEVQVGTCKDAEGNPIEVAGNPWHDAVQKFVKEEDLTGIKESINQTLGVVPPVEVSRDVDTPNLSK